MAVEASIREMYLENPKLKKHFLKGVVTTGRTLGRGAFGKVVELQMSGTRCAGKQIHDSLLGVDVAGVKTIIDKFVEECSLMAEVKHPNIVQFLGICMLEESKHPILVMEYLDMSLDSYLEAHLGNFPLSLKYRILLDVARGLQHLHTHDPIIIHRDLSSCNILLNKASLQAKIADLGNALLTESKRLMQTLSKMPGTLLYMPPEAGGANPKYDTSLDMFSFGHLALYVAIEIFPSDILPATFMDPTTEVIQGRTEIGRRRKYFDVLYGLEDLGPKGGEQHPFCAVIESCLHNLPDKRPTALKVLKVLEELVSPDEHLYSKLDLIDLAFCKNEAQEPTSAAYDHLPGDSFKQHYMRVQQLQGGAVGVVEACFLSKGIWPKKKVEKWKNYLLKIEGGEKLVCLKPKKRRKVVGEINLSGVLSVYTTQSGPPDRFCFKVEFDFKPTRAALHSSPWHLCTDTLEERSSWMEAIKPGSVPEFEDFYAEQAGKDPDIVKSKEEQSSGGRGIKSESRSDSCTQLAKKDTVPAVSLDEQEEHPSGEKGIKSQPGSGICTQLAEKDTAPAVSLDEQEEHPSGEKVIKSQSGSDICTQLAEEDTPAAESHYEQMCDADPDYKVLVPAKDYANQQQSGPFMEEGNLYQEIADVPPDQATESSLSKLEPAQIEKLVEMYYTLMEKVGHKAQPKETETTEQGFAGDTQPSPEPHPYQNLYEEVENEQDSGKIYRAAKPAEVKIPVPKPRKKGLQKGLLSKARMNGQPTTNGESLKKLGEFRKMTRSITPPIKQLVTKDPKDARQRPGWATADTTASESLYSIVEEDETIRTLTFQALYIRRSEIQNMEPIGKGQYGQVYKAEYIKDAPDRQTKKITVAVKTVRKYDSKEAAEDFLKEINVMTKFVHPNVIKMYGLVEQDHPWIVVEYLPNGDLRHFLQKNQCPMKMLVKYMLDVAMGMLYISDKGLVHRDIAARNVLVGSSRYKGMEVCKVSDFGLLREIPDGDEIYVATHNMPFPIRWMAPESLGDRVFSSASDVWSFGVLLWEMSNPTKNPYSEIKTNFQCALKVSNGYRLEIPHLYPEIVKSIMTSCWQHQPAKRPSFLLISTLLSEEVEFQLQ